MENSDVAGMARLLKTIADETRLRILGLLAERPRTGKDLASALDLSAPTISHHMRKLTKSEIVLADADAQRQWYRLNTSLLDESRRVPLGEPSPDIDVTSTDDERFRRKVVRDFFDGERLKSIPAQRKRRVIVLQHLIERFDPARIYSEREVNDMLRSAHDDVATLRRELVDYGYFLRDRGIYQVTRGAPKRDATMAQEIPGDERAWLKRLLSEVVTNAAADGHRPTGDAQRR